MKKMHNEQVMDLLQGYVSLGLPYAYESIPEIAQLTGWAQSSIKLALDSELYLDEGIDTSDDTSDDVGEEEDHLSLYEREDGDPEPLNFHDDRRW